MKLNISAVKHVQQTFRTKHKSQTQLFCSLVLHRARPASSPAPAVTQLGTHLEVGYTVADSCCGMLL